MNYNRHKVFTFCENNSSVKRLFSLAHWNFQTKKLVQTLFENFDHWSWRHQSPCWLCEFTDLSWSGDQWTFVAFKTFFVEHKSSVRLQPVDVWSLIRVLGSDSLSLINWLIHCCGVVHAPHTCLKLNPYCSKHFGVPQGSVTGSLQFQLLTVSQLLFLFSCWWSTQLFYDLMRWDESDKNNSIYAQL